MMRSTRSPDSRHKVLFGSFMSSSSRSINLVKLRRIELLPSHRRSARSAQ
jgi:hypothetical protein